MSRLILHSLAAVTLTFATGASATSYSAKAYDLSDGRLLYTEHHEERWEDGLLKRCLVSYRTPEGDEFAVKRLEFHQDPAAPDFDFLDRRSGYREGATKRAGSLSLYGGFDPQPTTIASPPAEPVIDAGFHRYIERHFEALAGGAKREVEFAVPALGRFFAFRVSKSAELQYRNRPAVRFRMRPTNPFLRLLTDPIDLVYDMDGRLREFVGTSNIKNETGDQFQARIVFEYDEDRVRIATKSPAAAPATGRMD